jgi:hypothetical protein
VEQATRHRIDSAVSGDDSREILPAARDPSQGTPRALVATGRAPSPPRPRVP